MTHAFCFFELLRPLIVQCNPGVHAASGLSRQYILVASASGEHACNATQAASPSIYRHISQALAHQFGDRVETLSRMVPDTVRVAVGILGVCSSITCTTTCCSDHITIS